MHLARFYLVGIPGNRRSCLDELAILDHIHLPRAELYLDQLVARPLEFIQRLVAHQIGQDAARLLPRSGLDIDALKIVTVARVALDHALRRAPGQADGGLDVGQVGQLDDVGDAAVAIERGLVKVEQRDLVAIDARLRVHLPLHRAGGGHRRQPLDDVVFVYLDPQRLGRIDNLFDFLLAITRTFLSRHGHPPEYAMAGDRG